MYKVWVLVLVHSAGREIYNLSALIDILNGPYAPFARGNLPDCCSWRACRLLALRGCSVEIYHIYMVPVVAFRCPQQLLAIVYELPPDSAVVDKLVRRFLYDGFQFSCLCRHGKHLIELVAALVVLHGHGLGVWRPLEPVKVILVFNALSVCLHPCSRAYIEYAGIELWQLVARFRIFLFVQIWLQLVPW